MTAQTLKAMLPISVRKVLKYPLHLYRFYLKNDAQYKNGVRWFADRGDETLRLDYPLNTASVVFDLGGYKGDFAADINSRFGADVYLFEPVRQFHAICAQRFHGNPKIHTFNFGLSSADGTFRISNEDNGSSVVKGNAGQGEVVTIKSFAGFVAERGIERIDLLKINIEGGEYDVLPQIVETGLINRVRFLQIQFHDFIEGAVEKRRLLQQQLARTHVKSWDYPFIWESWEIRSQ
jgi:FkbM family methyltransferase